MTKFYKIPDRNSERPSDSVEKLLSDWDLEDGVKVRTSGTKKGSFSKNKKRDAQLEKRDISGLKKMYRDRKRNGEPPGIYHPRQGS